VAHGPMLAMVLLAAVWGQAQAGIYKWVDDSGNVHYGDRAPAGDSRQIDVDTRPSSDRDEAVEAQRREKRRRLLDAFAKERADKQAMEAKRRQEKKEHEQHCLEMRDHLRRMLEAGYLYETDEAGNKTIYSAERRRSATQTYQEIIGKYCGSV